MKAIKTAFIILAFLLVSLYCSTALPSWTRDIKIDSGELKAVNYQLFFVGNRNHTVNPNVTVTRFQHYNNTGFSSAPRIILAMKSYGTIPATSVLSLTMGFRINIVSKNATNFTYTVSASGAILIALHYQYFAVDGYTNSLYLQFYTLNIANSSILLNDTSTSPRSQNFVLDNPGLVAVGDNFNSSQMLIQVWPIFFTYKATSNILSMEAQATITSKTQFTVTVIAKNGCLLSQLGISILYLNKTKVYEESFYMLFVDYTTVNITGTNITSPPTQTTMDNITAQYQFRNSQQGVKGFYLPFEAVMTVTGWYIAGFKETTVLNYASVQTRKRVCPANNTFFHVQDKYCMNACPTPYFYTNTNYTFCKRCHYTCYTCSSDTASSCSSCTTNSSRSLINNTCSCMNHYFDNGLQICSSCHYSCLTCMQVSNSSCTVCGLNTSRLLLNNSCICDIRFFDNGQQICTQCHQSCLTCYDSSSSGCLSCDISAQQTLVNSSCICNDGYFFNSTCLPCYSGCLQCLYDTMLQNYQCNTCDTSNHWQLNNSTNNCTCQQGYYNSIINSNQTCTLCSLLGCSDCIFNTSVSCIQCDGLNNFQLLNGTCLCKDNYTLINLTCINNSSNSTLCGNSIVEASEQCDDGNNLNSDGCSSECKIEQNHNCFINGTISICFYNFQISFITKQIFKQPFENRVTLILIVIAPNCNAIFLKLYLQNSPAILVANTGRLLAASSQISSTSVSFSSQTNTLTVDFEYNSNIDLTSKMVKFVPSQDQTSGNKRYFFDSPPASITLSPPTNLLLTTYSSSDDLQKTKIISSIFAALIGISWLFWLISLCYNQTAPAVEYLLILQIAYQSLLQRKIITDGWVGLVLYGKYSYGYNVDYEIANLYDRMRILSLSTHLFHTLNITTAILGLVTLAILIVLIYQTFKIRNEEVYKADLNSTNAKISVKQQGSQRQRPQQEDQQSKYRLMKGVVLFLFQIATSLTLLTVKIAIITAMLSESQVTTQLAIIGAILFTCYTIIWILIYKFYDMEFFNDFSFKRVLRSPEYVSQNTSLSIKLGNFIVKYYYFMIFLLLAGFGVMDGSPQIGAPFYIVALIGSIFLIITIIVFGVYFRGKHQVRACCNLLALAVIFVLHLVETINTTDVQQNFTGPLICISILILSFFINTGILFNIEFRRFKMNRKQKKSKKNQIAPIPKIIIRNQTEEPQMQRSPVNVEIIMNRRMEEQEQNQVQIRKSEHSNESICKDSKFQSIGSKSHRNSYPETQKKFFSQRNQEEYQQTKQKKRQQQFQKLDSILNNVPQTYIRREKLQNGSQNQVYSQSSQVERIEVVDISRSFSDLAKTKTNFKPSNIVEIPQTAHKNYGIVDFQQ